MKRQARCGWSILFSNVGCSTEKRVDYVRNRRNATDATSRQLAQRVHAPKFWPRFNSKETDVNIVTIYLRPKHRRSEIVFNALMNGPVHRIGLANHNEKLLFQVRWQISRELGIRNLVYRSCHRCHLRSTLLLDTVLFELVVVGQIWTHLSSFLEK